MTHIDPKASGKSPRHPANWAKAVPPRGHEQAVPLDIDAMVSWLVLEDEPVRMDNPDAAVIGQARWEEYRQLLDRFGSDQQKELLDVIAHEDWPDEIMPTLTELRTKRDIAQAAEEGAVKQPPVTPESGSKADELAAKLAALNEAGL